MPTFTYQARDAQGRTQRGELAASDSAALATQLRGRGLIILELKPSAPAKPPEAEKAPLISLPVTMLDIELGLLQISSMLRSGLTLLSALRTAADQARRPKMAKVWLAVADRIQQGSSFAAALKEHPWFFPEFIVQLVSVGEQSGTLEQVLSRGAEQLERSRNLRAILISALVYPSIVLFLSFGVAAFMLLSVIPKIQKFLSSTGRKLPALTQALLDFSNWLQHWLPYLTIGAIAVLVAAIVFYKWPPGRLIFDRQILRVPIFGRVFRLSGTAVFARGMALLLQSGITQLEALRTIENLLGNKALGRLIAEARQRVMQGGTLSGATAEKGLFMPMLSKTIAVGESTGTMDQVLNESARFHEDQLARTVRRLSVLVEPTIIVIVGSVVGFVYIAFFVALFSLAGGH